MWATRFPVSFVSYPSTKRPPITDRRCLSLVVVAARPPRSSSVEDLGGLGHAVLNALQSPSSSSSKTLISSQRGEQSSKKKSGESLKEERELSGSEVLLALQKARARRSQRLKNKKGGSAVEGGGRGGAAEKVDYKNVRPLNVKSNWGVRLEELERRLQEFINS